MQREANSQREPSGRIADELGADGRILALDEAADMLKTSYSTVYRLVMDGELRASRIRSSWRTSTDACNELIAKRFEEQSVICGAGGPK